MKPGLPIARLLAAMILAILAWAVPSSGQAHDGHHAGAGHHHHPAPTARATESAPTERISVVASVQVDEAGVVGAHGLCCCGAACCVPGILASGVTVSRPALGRVLLRPGDALSRAALGPASPSEPPRPLA